MAGWLTFQASITRVKVDQPEHLRMQIQGTQYLVDGGEYNSAGCTVATKTQAKLLILAGVNAPFDRAPSMKITFETEEGKWYDYPLRLPLVSTCFMESVNLVPGAFMQRWKCLEGPDRECQDVMKLPPNSSRLDEAYMERVSKIIVDGLKFGRCKLLRRYLAQQHFELVHQIRMVIISMLVV